MVNRFRVRARARAGVRVRVKVRLKCNYSTKGVHTYFSLNVQYLHHYR